jgi:hypothetical protein
MVRADDGHFEGYLLLMGAGMHKIEIGQRGDRARVHGPRAPGCGTAQGLCALTYAVLTTAFGRRLRPARAS